jgi:hypothetical protein
MRNKTIVTITYDAACIISLYYDKRLKTLDFPLIPPNINFDPLRRDFWPAASSMLPQNPGDPSNEGQDAMPCPRKS